MRDAVRIYVTPIGCTFRIPDDLFKRAKWAKHGDLDRRYVQNSEFAAYAKLQEIAEAEGIEEYA
jgi:hypothetical protein